MVHLWLPLIVAPLVASQALNDSTLWGPYRPNLYFGLRPRIPQSLMTGLMWFGNQNYQSIARTRHACEQDDKLGGYGWTVYDPRQGGVQVINDTDNNVKLTTEFLKVPGGDHGGSWAARIKGEPINKSLPSRPSVIFYLGLEGLGGLDMETDENENGLTGPVKFTGTTMELDDFSIRIVDGPANAHVTEGSQADSFKDRIGKTHVLGQRAPPGDIWKAKDLIMNVLINRAQGILSPYREPQSVPPDPSFVLQLPDEVYTGSNLYAVQKSFEGEFQFDVFFDSASTKQKLSSTTLDQGIPALVASYDKKFQSTLPYPLDFPRDQQEGFEHFSKALTSSISAGVGYFYGTSIVDKKFSYEWDEEDTGNSKQDHSGARLTEPRALLTATPSRSFFPRGFYWDEGFHLVHIGNWDNDFSLEILKDWIGLIDEDGWVGREQILGEEARSKVPQEFQTQVPNYANPPTLTMAVTAFISRVKAASISVPLDDLGLNAGAQAPLSIQTAQAQDPGNAYLNPDRALEYLKSIYQPLKRHYEWFRRTQRGQIKQYSRKARSRTEAYRWRGRTENHVLTSGMDDYPRGPPHAGELHLDLISWMAFFTRTMKDIASYVGEKDDEKTYGEIEIAILNNIEDLHWNEKENMYCDLNVDADEESTFVCHKGYLSLFPLLLGLLPPDSSHVGSLLDLLSDPEHLWSPYGIRSLSLAHPEFGKGENYWKGPIWIQMNYLALSALHKTYAGQEGPYQTRAKEIYTQLRQNVVGNVYKEYNNTGYVWEQYDAVSGKGQRSHPFTGWTSLVSLILSEKYS